MQAQFVRFTETGKTAIVMIKEDALVLNATPVYVSAEGVKSLIGENPEPKTKFEVSDNLKLVDLVWEDPDTNEMVTATTKDGVVLKTLAAK